MSPNLCVLSVERAPCHPSAPRILMWLLDYLRICARLLWITALLMWEILLLSWRWTPTACLTFN